MVNPSDISGGYLVELDNNYYDGEKCYFKTSNGNAYVIKSPELASQEQVEYIARVSIPEILSNKSTANLAQW